MPLAAIVPLENEIDVEFGMAVRVGVPQPDGGVLIVVTLICAGAEGKLSKKLIPLTAVVDVLVKVKDRVEVPPSGMEVGANDLEMLTGEDMEAIRVEKEKSLL